MPAIHPARLRQQAAVLVEHFYDPPAFIRSLHHLFDFYTERIHPTSQASELPALLPAYRVRPPVLRQILLELAPLIDEDPESGLVLCDALWEQPYLEFRLLAAGLLGQIPYTFAEATVSRLQAWIRPGIEDRLVEALFTKGVACLRKNNQTALIRLVEDWLNEPDLFYQHLGLRLLLSLLKEPEFENLPVFYRLIQSLTRTCPARLRPDLLDALAVLAQRSPNETAYFLRQTLAMPNSPDTPFLLRLSLREFPPEIQENLRNLGREFYNKPRSK